MINSMIYAVVAVLLDVIVVVVLVVAVLTVMFMLLSQSLMLSLQFHWLLISEFLATVAFVSVFADRFRCSRYNRLCLGRLHGRSCCGYGSSGYSHGTTDGDADAGLDAS